MQAALKRYESALGVALESSVESIAAAQLAHLRAFNFTSMGANLSKDLPLELDTLVSRVTSNSFGGYCFEHNKLFCMLLEAKGLEVIPIYAKVRNNHFGEVPNTHRTTLVRLEGELYLVDVGFGALCPSSPIKLCAEYTTASNGFDYRIVSYSEREDLLEVMLEDKPFGLYTFTRDAISDVEYELGHFYSHKHPNAKFVNNMVVSRMGDGVIYSLVNNHFETFSTKGREKRVIPSADMLAQLLAEYFEYDLSDDEVAHLYQRFVAAK